MADEMLTVAEARERILRAANPNRPRALPLTETLECVLAEDLISPVDLPLWDNSSVDGYALRSADVTDANDDSPIYLHVIGESPAGSSSSVVVEPQTCARIFTGAPVPPGADAVVMQEDTRPHHEGYIGVIESTEPGENIRRAGDDVKKSEVVVRKGALLGAPQLGIAAAVGSAQLIVHPRPRVGLLSTGAELVVPGTPLREGQIYDANSFSLYAFLRKAGCEPVELGIADDTRDDLHEKLDYGLSECDAVITIGGVSVGKYDLVKDVLAELGCQLDFWKVAMRPGKPFVFGTHQEKLVFGLPGNPVSAAVTFLILVRPALLRLRGLSEIDLPNVTAEVVEDFVNKGDRLHYMRASLQRDGDRWLVRPMSRQGSHVISSLTNANALVAVPESTTIPSGQKIKAIQFAILV